MFECCYLRQGVFRIHKWKVHETNCWHDYFWRNGSSLVALLDVDKYTAHVFRGIFVTIMANGEMRVGELKRQLVCKSSESSF